MIVRAFGELAQALAAVEARHGFDFARGVLLALFRCHEPKPGDSESLDARLVCSSLCKRFGWLDPFPEALAEGRAVQGVEVDA